MSTNSTITNEEYIALKTDRDAMKEKMDTAESDFVYQTYKEVWSVFNRRYAKATELVVAAETRDARAQSKAKREARSKNDAA